MPLAIGDAASGVKRELDRPGEGHPPVERRTVAIVVNDHARDGIGAQIEVQHQADAGRKRHGFTVAECRRLWLSRDG
jgi:hypothetical protein